MQRTLARVKLQRVMQRQHVGHVIIVQVTEHDGVQILDRNFLLQPREYAGSAIEQD